MNNLVKFKIVGVDTPAAVDVDQESYLNPDFVVAVEPKGKNQTSIRLDTEGAYQKIAVEGSLKETMKKLD